MSPNSWSEVGWSEIGVIPDYAIHGDGWCDTVVFYKRLDPPEAQSPEKP